MDSITQAALGAAVGQLTVGKKVGMKRASILGAIGGTIPDLDVILLPFLSELDKISIHRGYSHSLLFCLIAGIVFALLLKRFSANTSVRSFHWFIFAFLTFLTHILLDSFTTYGTQLFLPFTDWRVSFDSISIIDPVYTLPLLIGVVTSIYLSSSSSKNKQIPNKIGFTISSIYLLFTLANKEHIEKVFQGQLTQIEEPYYKMLTVPVSAGNLIWYGVAKNDSALFMGKYSMIRKNEIDFHEFPVNDHLLDDLDPYLVAKLKWFAQDFYTVAEHKDKIRVYNMQCDMQGIRHYGVYKAPTAFYYEIELKENGKYELSSGMHPKD